MTPAPQPFRSMILGGLGFALVCTVRPLLAQAEENLIPSGDFEMEAAEPFPANWRGIVGEVKNPAEMIVRGGEPGKNVHSGAGAIRLYVSRTGSGAAEGRKRNVLETIKSGPQMPEPSIRLEPGKTYRLSYWMKREGFHDPTHQMVVEFLGYPFPARGDSRQSLVLFRESGPCGWVFKERVFSIPEGSDIAEGSLIFRLLFPPGEVNAPNESVATIDDVLLVEDK